MPGYINAPDSLFNNKQVIKFTAAFISDKSVKFHAFVTEYSDNFESNWQRDETYGRMDDIQSFQNTKRTIDLAWQTVAASKAEGMRNLQKVEQVIQMLYPPYVPASGKIFNINGAPVIRLKFMNLIQDAKSGGGLLGTMSGLTATPDLELGFFTSNDNSKVFPKVIDLSCTFYPLHEHLLGWFGPFFNQSNYPYGAAGEGINFVDMLPPIPEMDLDGIPTGAELSEAFNSNKAADLARTAAMLSAVAPTTEKTDLSSVAMSLGPKSAAEIIPQDEVAAQMNNTSKNKKKPKQVGESQAKAMLEPASTEAHAYSEEGLNMSEEESQVTPSFIPGVGSPEDPFGWGQFTGQKWDGQHYVSPEDESSGEQTLEDIGFTDAEDCDPTIQTCG